MFTGNNALTFSFDYLTLYDGLTSRASELGKYCGSTLPKQVSSSSQSVTIIFHSDDSVGGKGFRLAISQSNVFNYF